MLRAILAALIIASLSFAPAWARRSSDQRIPTSTPDVEAGATDGSLTPDSRFAIAATNTTMLASYTFDAGATCSAQGWSVVDATSQHGTFWHVDDFVDVNINPGDAYAPLQGAKSLWCGARASDTGETCWYLVLPGYGCNWNQLWQTKDCIPVDGTLDVSFLMQLDSEAAYDATFSNTRPIARPT